MYLSIASDTIRGVATCDTSRIISSMETWMDRARRRMHELGIRQDDLIRPLGVKTRGAVGHYLSGRRKPDPDQVVALARWLRMSTDELLGCSIPAVREPAGVYRTSGLRTGYVSIPAMNAEAAMGHGRAAPVYEEAVDAMTVSAAWLKRHVVATSTANLALITAYGDSMEGTFADGDVLLVDRGINEVKIDAVYVLALRDELYVKRLQRRPDGSILMISDNRKYEPYVIEDDRRDEFRVMGRVLLAWNAKKL